MPQWVCWDPILLAIENGNRWPSYPCFPRQRWLFWKVTEQEKDLCSCSTSRALHSRPPGIWTHLTWRNLLIMVSGRIKDLEMPPISYLWQDKFKLGWFGSDLQSTVYHGGSHDSWLCPFCSQMQNTMNPSFCSVFDFHSVPPYRLERPTATADFPSQLAQSRTSLTVGIRFFSREVPGHIKWIVRATALLCLLLYPFPESVL